MYYVLFRLSFFCDSFFFFFFLGRIVYCWLVVLWYRWPVFRWFSFRFFSLCKFVYIIFLFLFFFFFFFVSLVLMKLSLVWVEWSRYHVPVVYLCINSFFILIRLVCKYYTLFHLPRHACTISAPIFFFFFSFFFGESFIPLWLYFRLFFWYSILLFFSGSCYFSLCKIVYITFIFYSISFIFMII